MSLIRQNLICDDCLGYLGSAARALPRHACRCPAPEIDPIPPAILAREAEAQRLAGRRFAERAWL